MTVVARFVVLVVISALTLFICILHSIKCHQRRTLLIIYESRTRNAKQLVKNKVATKHHAMQEKQRHVLFKALRLRIHLLLRPLERRTQGPNIH